jgi:hypothetical protein
MRRLGASVAVVTAVLLGATACTPQSRQEKLISCLDDAGVDYTVENGTVIVTEDTHNDSEATKEAARSCGEVVE